MRPKTDKPTVIERIVIWIGSVPSILFHSALFLFLLLLTLYGPFPRDTVLLIWNTCVSLEAIYLAVFIQYSVNRNTESLREVEEDIDEIQEDVEELGEDVDEIQEDIEEMSEEDAEEERREQAQADNLERLTTDVKRLLADLEALKKAK